MKTFIRTFALVLAALLAMSLIACSSSEKPEPTPAPEGFDWSLNPSDFNEWTSAHLKIYLRELGVIGSDDIFLTDMSEGDYSAMNADGGFMYIDMNGGTIMDIIMHFDSNNEAASAMLEKIRADHAITPDFEGAEPTPQDALLGGFAFSYTLGSDTEHHAALVKAIKDLAEHFGITPDFITE